jgi:hypothetical protein
MIDISCIKINQKAQMDGFILNAALQEQFYSLPEKIKIINFKA